MRAPRSPFSWANVGSWTEHTHAALLVNNIPALASRLNGLSIANVVAFLHS
jgi:hypothetical protein